MSKKKNIDQLNPKSPKGWMRTRLGSNIVEWQALKNGKITDDTIRVECDRKLNRCFVSKRSKYMTSPRKAISYAESLMKKSRR